MASDTPTIDSDALNAYVEGYLSEDDALTGARARGVELGCSPISCGGGAALRFLATTLRARAVVEIGTGSGVSGLYLLRGMAPDGVLTSIDVEPEHQRAAKRTFADAGFGPGRARLIMGRALDVLPRLTDEGYDLLYVDGAKAEYPAYHEQGVRLLRPGGVLAFDSVLWAGRVANPARRDAETVALREVARAVRDDDRLVPVLLPLGDGLLIAAKVP
ncbi:O-methyltransferase [Actinophytocola gossypii]|uniref:O-methyltransferase n=1 Tax=Actinophytocola gossypii TaxID=2812003 RepID=A0ABT2JJ73_9PSEU|nr:O-methyltransferase [Actinophytocola gossypii]MCT2587440.1 O-methyltransferase [Actinophytocola gossypii]